MKSVVCFGDSNTWGSIPGNKGRYPWGTRWTSIAQEKLGTDYRVHEEGLPGRTTVWEDPMSTGMRGLTDLPRIIYTHSPIDVLLIMLGTNDLKAHFHLTPYSIAQGLEALLSCVKATSSPPLHTIVISPPPLTETKDSGVNMTFEGAFGKFALMRDYFATVATNNRCTFFDAGTVCESSPCDGIHINEQAHYNLGQALANEIIQLDFC